MWLYEIAGVLTGMLFVGIYLRRKPSQPFSGKLFFALLLQTTASVAVWVMASPLIGEFLFWETFIWAFLLPMQGGLLMIILINGFEMSEMIWSEGLRRRFTPLSPSTGFAFPRVSIHVPICKEPPEMVKETLNSLAALDYPNYEVSSSTITTLPGTVAAGPGALRDAWRQVPFLPPRDAPGLQGRRAQLRLKHTDPAAEFVRWSTATTSSIRVAPVAGAAF